MKHIPNDNFISDEQLLTILDAKEAGKSFSDALTETGVGTLSQEDTETLRAIWKMHGSLMSEAHNISPSKAILSRIIEGAETSTSEIVTNSPIVGYNERRTDNQSINSDNYINTFMQINWKFVAPIAVLVIVVAAGMSMGDKESGSLAISNQPSTVATTESAPGAAMVAIERVPVMEKKQPSLVAVSTSGDVDTLVASLTLEADGDKTLLDDSSADIALVTADSQSITDFNTTYNETTF